MKKLMLILSTSLVIIIAPSGICAVHDSLPIGGKGMYLWQLWSTNGGGKNLNSIIDKLKNLGVGWLVIKMGDGDSYYNSPNHSLYSWATTNYGNMDDVVALFHNNGIKLLAFQYVYGVPHHWGNSATETDVANSILNIKGIDGLIIDAEIQYDTLKSRVTAAEAYCDKIHAKHPDAFIGLTAWARINGHVTFPWTSFLTRVEVNMPQTYWAARPTTPQNELNLMSSQFTAYTKTWVSMGDSEAAKPILPLGQGEYFGYSNDVVQGDIAEFCNLSQMMYKYPGVSLWEYNQISHSYIWEEYSSAWTPTGISDESNSPVHYNLSQNYPNPFNPTTNIQYSISRRQFVELKIFNVLGQEIETLVNAEKHAGNYQVEFNAANLPSGVYFYRIQAGSFNQVKKMILLK